MKYIKLFEDFSDKILDNLEDIKWIIVSFCDDRISYKLLTNFEDKLIVYTLSEEQTNQEEFESLEGRIKDLNTNYEYIVTEGKIVIGLPEYIKVFEDIEKYKIKNYTFNDDGSIDVDDDVKLSFKHLSKLPVKFRNVSGFFDCKFNDLISLEGCPETVGGNFNCDDNLLISLEGSPKNIGGDFDCSSNRLTSLEGSPLKVVGDFNCKYNNLTSLVGGPKIVGGNFICSVNGLISLDGSPDTISGDFNCDSNSLTSLDGSPETVGGNFNCYYNELTTLEGSPKTVGGDFNCMKNTLISRKGIGEVKGILHYDK